MVYFMARDISYDRIDLTAGIIKLYMYSSLCRSAAFFKKIDDTCNSMMYFMLSYVWRK
jgi:hypothetical protein